jgi:hypothetical protein
MAVRGGTGAAEVERGRRGGGGGARLGLREEEVRCWGAGYGDGRGAAAGVVKGLEGLMMRPERDEGSGVDAPACEGPAPGVEGVALCGEPPSAV